MKPDAATLLEEDNTVSRRTALVHDDGDVACLRLMPSLPDQISGKLHPDWRSEFAWLYRHMRSHSGERELVSGLPGVARDLKPLVFDLPPKLSLVWSVSGNSVAICVDGEPWAFIDEETHKGYSKGVLIPPTGDPVGNPWDQALFERRFKV